MTAPNFFNIQYGIDLLGEDSLAQYVADPIVNFTSVGLIIMSGLGFVVWCLVCEALMFLRSLDVLTKLGYSHEA